MPTTDFNSLTSGNSPSASSTDMAYTLEVKVPDPLDKTKTTTQQIRLLVDWKEVQNKPLVFSSRFEFPNTGNNKFLYIATDENKVYRYDSVNSVYKIIGSDWHDIKLIDCGGAANEQ